MLTVAAVQATPIPGDVAANALSGAALIARAADQGARLVVLPELYLSAYHPPAIRADPVATMVRADETGLITDPRLDPLREGGIVAVIGAGVVHPDGMRTCSSIVVDRAGEIRVAYNKQYLCGPDEKELFTPGAEGSTLEIDGWRFGLGICYDGCFPEHGRAAAGDDVHGYLVPAAYLQGSRHRRDIYYAARALDNTMYVVFANIVGGQAPWSFNGGAAIYDPEGRCLARGDDETESVVVATLDKQVLAQTRSWQSMLVDRHIDHTRPRRRIAV